MLVDGTGTNRKKVEVNIKYIGPQIVSVILGCSYHTVVCSSAILSGSFGLI